MLCSAGSVPWKMHNQTLFQISPWAFIKYVMPCQYIVVRINQLCIMYKKGWLFTTIVINNADCMKRISWLSFMVSHWTSWSPGSKRRFNPCSQPCNGCHFNIQRQCHQRQCHQCQCHQYHQYHHRRLWKGESQAWDGGFWWSELRRFPWKAGCRLCYCN